jgi:hypothetical protein
MQLCSLAMKDGTGYFTRFSKFCSEDIGIIWILLATLGIYHCLHAWPTSCTRIGTKKPDKSITLPLPSVQLYMHNILYEPYSLSKGEWLLLSEDHPRIPRLLIMQWSRRREISHKINQTSVYESQQVHIIMMYTHNKRSRVSSLYSSKCIMTIIYYII